jgi:hypothetical protein
MTFDPAAARKRCQRVLVRHGIACAAYTANPAEQVRCGPHDEAWPCTVIQALDRIAELEAREQALRGYVTHGWRCATRDVRSSCYHLPRLPDDEHCDCGLREALAATAPKGVET